MKRKWTSVALLILISLVCTAAGIAAQRTRGAAPPASSAKNIVVTPDQLQWTQGPLSLPTSKVAVLEGDPEKPGFFVMRLTLPAGTKIPAHMHDNVERVTVISGKINLAMGEKPVNPQVLPAGSYFALIPKTVHNAWVDEETVVQIATMGPWGMRPVRGVGK